MAKTEDQTEIAELQRLNAQLSSSLKRCRRILADCQSKLASNNNVPEALDTKAGERSG